MAPGSDYPTPTERPATLEERVQKDHNSLLSAHDHIENLERILTRALRFISDHIKQHPDLAEMTKEVYALQEKDKEGSRCD